MSMFYTYLKLQGSQTLFNETVTGLPFYTYLKLQGSQTVDWSVTSLISFYTYLKLQGSQTPQLLGGLHFSFTLI